MTLDDLIFIRNFLRTCAQIPGPDFSKESVQPDWYRVRTLINTMTEQLKKESE